MCHNSTRRCSKPDYPYVEKTTVPSVNYDLIRDIVRSKELGNPIVLRFLYNVLCNQVDVMNSRSSKNVAPVENFQTQVGEMQIPETPDENQLGPKDSPDLHKGDIDAATAFFGDDYFTESCNWPIKSEPKDEDKVSSAAFKSDRGSEIKDGKTEGQLGMGDSDCSSNSTCKSEIENKDEKSEVKKISEPEEGDKDSDSSYNSTGRFISEGETKDTSEFEVGKENKYKTVFFASDSGSGSEVTPERTDSSKNTIKKSDDDNESPVDEEEAALRKLLRLASEDLSKKKPSPEDEENSKDNGKTIDKKKKKDKSILDCSNENGEGCEEEISELKQNLSGNSSKCSEPHLNTKNAFFLSSSESNSEEEKTEEKKVKDTKKKGKTNQKRPDKKKKDDGLSEFRIPSLNLERKDKKKESNVFESITLDSSGDEKKIRKKKTCFEKSDSSSDSDLQVSIIKKPSPKKGRKNIKKIWKPEELLGQTMEANRRENERKKRLKERQNAFERFFPDHDTSKTLVLDFDADTGEKLVVVHDSLASRLKPHQRKGVQFMWNNCIESSARIKEDRGSGCILAHCMGLGKSLQVITLVHTLLSQDLGLKTVLILCPLNTVNNWIHEFNHWLKQVPHKIKVLTVSGQSGNRIWKIREWTAKGGVLIMGYDRFRAMLKTKGGKNLVNENLLDPGPDLVVCDEGHLMKNEKSSLSVYLSHLKTARRIVLTGTPMQNNLLEYYCMVQFVKPNLLGVKREFLNRFVNPINNGQFEDSTESDVRLMKRRAHILHTMVGGFVQRFSYNVLTPFLPEKHEYAISVSLTETQIALYRDFIESTKLTSKSLFKHSSWLQRIWTHPLLMYRRAEKEKNGDIQEMKISHWGRFVEKGEYESCTSSNKLVLMFEILVKCKEVGDKVLIFSQYLENLNLIEYFLKKANKAYLSKGDFEYPDVWKYGEDYLRIDGSTSSENRHAFCQQFNNFNNKRSRLFLISTKAGGLGINLVAANRVIVFDSSWNPSHDMQSIFRVYRFGQVKSCFIYRFLASATLEEKIYRRQVTKLSLAHRILDEQQIERHYTSENLQELFTFEPVPRDKWEMPKIPKDRLFADILARNRETVVGYHEHDSLFENKEEEELTEEERRVAWEEYEIEKSKTGNRVVTENVQSFATNVPLDCQPSTSFAGARTKIPECSNENEIPLCKIVNVRTLKF